MHIDVVLGPAPCKRCGAWVEWLGVGPWVALESHEPHDCGPYLVALARHAITAGKLQVARWPRDAYSPVFYPPEQVEVPWLTWRLMVALGLVAVFMALVLVRYQAGLL